jgi:hypothetical protein
MTVKPLPSQRPIVGDMSFRVMKNGAQMLDKHGASLLTESAAWALFMDSKASGGRTVLMRGDRVIARVGP